MTSYFERVQPTYLENWPAELCRLSIAQVDIPLCLASAEALGANIKELGAGFREKPEDEPPNIAPLREEVSRAVWEFPHGAFIRLGSRSPKDSWLWSKPPGPRILPEDANPLRYLLDCSERISDDLHLALANNYPPHIFVRQWLEIPAWTEFRCFMRDKRLVAVSQYHYHEAFVEISNWADCINWAIGVFFTQYFRPAIHLDSVVFDVFVKLRHQDQETELEVKLLELNPAGVMTDPCLFDYRNNGSDFAGHFRYKGRDGKAVEVPLVG